MGGSVFALAASTFLAAAVETVEALTIVLAVGITRGWRSVFLGILAAASLLAVLVVAIGPGLVAIPIQILRLVVGGLLLVFGLQWLRKAILRAAGLKAIHDEVAIFAREAAAAREQPPTDPRAFDPYGFALSFKGVLLEGLEVVFIVLTFGASARQIPVAALSAVVAAVAVTVVGIAVRGPLARVPENTLKFIVGIMLTAYGIFWGGEGAGVAWPGNDAAILVIATVTVLASLLAVVLLRRVPAALTVAVPS